MKDMLGAPLAVGDAVLFAIAGDGTSTMCVGVVSRFCKVKVEVTYSRTDGKRWYSYSKYLKGWTTIGRKLTMPDKLIALQAMNFGPQIQEIRKSLK